MNWFKKHADAIAIIAIVISGMWIMMTNFRYIDTKINDMNINLSNDINKVRLELSQEIYLVRNNLSKEISELKNEVEKIETVLIMQKIAPKEIFASKNDK